MPRRDWFEISHEGWRRRSRARSLGRLLLEAVQNAFDAEAATVAVDLEPGRVRVEDDARDGLSDERLVYTVFLSDKADDRTKRGRLGRGLKELIAAMDAATVETVGARVVFDAEGRRQETSERTRGTCVELRRAFSEDELREARTSLRLCIPPKGTSLRVDGRLVRRPKHLLTLGSCELETVEVEDGVERAVAGVAPVSVYEPRRGQVPHLCEMGVPLVAWDLPWHVDVGQRVPLEGGRDAVPERFALRLKAVLLESMIHRYLETKDLRADWVHEVIARTPIRTSVLDAYVSRAYPRGAVLGGTRRANDRARQLGAHVIDASSLSQGAYLALSRVVETADDFVRRRNAELTGEPIEPDATQQRFADAVRWLARRVAGRVVRVAFFARDPSDAGLLEDANCDADAKLLSFNVRGPLRFEDVLDPSTLGVVLHELAHLDTPEHDHRFIERLQWLAGQTARVLAEGGPELADRLRRGEP
ncbi:MAG: sensor histidine kinase [Sandaracinus sp.]|nr:sensor histidine kinase [Sandaracinus sp.]MCB9612355.1 sensor histidine kinase [Sandaracinus sp.]MCB9633485.1 sensor histidine kinase [Sandaracinus sp.]